MNIKQFYFAKARQSLVDRKVSVSADVRFSFMHDCEKLGIRPTIPRLLDWCDHWTQQFMGYSVDDEANNKPFDEWRPKR